MDKPARSPIARSFERHMRAQNRSERTIATDLIGVRQADAFLPPTGTIVEAAPADPMRRRKRPIVPDKLVLSVPGRSTGLDDP
jgi:hypothetical protein